MKVKVFENFVYKICNYKFVEVMTRASFFNKVNFLVVSLNDVLFCKNSKCKK